MGFTKSWDESTPQGTDAHSVVDDKIREFKYGIRERLAVDHDFRDDESGSEDTITPDGTIGYHKKVTLTERSSNPSNVSNTGILYTKDVSGVTELFYIDSGGNVKQLTTGGKLNVESDEAVLLSGDQTIAGVKTFSSIPVLPSSDPTSDNQATRKKYVDDAISSGNVDKLDGYDYNETEIKPFGSWESKSFGTVYQASTDGFAIGYAHRYGNEVILTGYTDSSNPPTTIRSKFSAEAVDGTAYGTILLPVKKGDYWKIVVDAGTADSLYWLPMGV